MKSGCDYKSSARGNGAALRFGVFVLVLTALLLSVPSRRAVEGATPPKDDRYFLRVSGCDDGGRAYLNNNLIVDVGFGEDSNWLDITQDIAGGKADIKFEVINKTGAITYVFQVRKNNKMIFEQACGTVAVVGCENNRAFRVGSPRKFNYTIRKESS